MQKVNIAYSSDKALQAREPAYQTRRPALACDKSSRNSRFRKLAALGGSQIGGSRPPSISLGNQKELRELLASPTNDTQRFHRSVIGNANKSVLPSFKEIDLHSYVDTVNKKLSRHGCRSIGKGGGDTSGMFNSTQPCVNKHLKDVQSRLFEKTKA